MKMGAKAILAILLSVLVTFFSGAAMAQHKHDYGSSSPSVSKKETPHSMHPSGKPAQAVTVEGLKITFEVMAMEEHMEHMAKGGGHNEAHHSQSHMIMVTVQDTASKEIISDAKVGFTVISPSGAKATGEMEWSGDHYGGGFSPKEKGKYRVELKIESGGMEKEAKFIYPPK
jgi:hypothetical protein